jgi:glutaredoxin 3
MIRIYGKDSCDYCNAAKKLCEEKGVEYTYYFINEDISLEDFVEKFPGKRTIPQITRDDKYVGGYSDLQQLILGGKI